MDGLSFMASLPPQGSQAGQVTSDAFLVQASIDVDEMLARLVNETRRSLNDNAQKGLTGEALAQAVTADLENLSDTPIEQAGRGAASESFNLGRNLGIQQRLDQIDVVVRTEVLDENTCDPCRSLDGQVFQVNTPAYFENMPPNQCEGRDLCRGFYLARGVQ